jgi:hypothetical protein
MLQALDVKVFSVADLWSNVLLAVGICSDRFARYNYKIGAEMAICRQWKQLEQKGQEQQRPKQQSQQQQQPVAAASTEQAPAPLAAEPDMLATSIKQHCADFEHCLDFADMHAVNKLLAEAGVAPMFPLVDSTALDNAISALDQATLNSKVPDTPPPGMEEVSDWLDNLGDFDEGVLDDDELDEDSQWLHAAAMEAAADGVTAADSSAHIAAPAEAAAHRPVARGVAARDVHAAGVAMPTGNTMAAAGLASQGRTATEAPHTLGHEAAAPLASVGAAPSEHGGTSPYGSSKRRASAGVAAAVEACLTEGDSEDEYSMGYKRFKPNSLQVDIDMQDVLLARPDSDLVSSQGPAALPQSTGA